MAKVECFTPEGVMEMKEPVDVREAVENCGYTREAPASNFIKLTRKDPDKVIRLEEVSQDKTLDKMNKKELTAEAESLGIELDGSENKAVIIGKIDAKLEED